MLFLRFSVHEGIICSHIINEQFRIAIAQGNEQDLLIPDKLSDFLIKLFIIIVNAFKLRADFINSCDKVLP